MKRFIILLALIISAVGASAQSIGTLFRQYRYEEKANYIHITRFAMSIVKAFAKTDSEDKEALKALSSFRILSLEDCTSTVKQSFQKTLQTFRPTGYTPFIIAKRMMRSLTSTLKRRTDISVSCSSLPLTIMMEPLCRLKGN